MDKGLVAEEGPARQVLDSPKSDRLCTFLSRMSFVGNYCNKRDRLLA